MKKFMVLAILMVLFSCGGGSGPMAEVETSVKDFMSEIKAGNLDQAVAMIKNEIDEEAPARIKTFFEGKTVNSFKVLKAENAESAKIMLSQGIARPKVEIEFGSGKQTLEFIVEKSDDKWAVNDIITP